VTAGALAIRTGTFLRRLKRCEVGLALIEMAYVTPVLLTLTMGGAELANYATVQMRVSQLALQVADNASRMGSGLPLASKQITETMINDVLAGAQAQASDMNLMGSQQEGGVTVQKARIIISDLEPVANPNTTNKFRIVWQRCVGPAATFVSKYGVQGTTNLDGMGSPSVSPPDNNAMQFVEVRYRYQPLFIGKMGFVNYINIDSEAAMLVRDDRDLSQVYNPDAVTQATC